MTVPVPVNPRAQSSDDMDVEIVAVGPPARRSNVPKRPPMIGSYQSEDWFCFTPEAAQAKFDG